MRKGQEEIRRRCEEANKRFERLTDGFPSVLRQATKYALPELLFLKLRPMPSIESCSSMKQWEKEVNKALKHNERILKSYEIGGGFDASL